jgi:LysM repeat protein
MLFYTKHFLMKRFFAVFLAISSTAALSAQTPFYILFNKSCMDQLEYKYTYYGNTMQAYSIRPTGAEQFLLNAANEGITSPTLPKGIVNCKDLKLTTDFVDMVNGHARNIYMVFQRAQGDYLMMPVIGATYISRNGAFYLVRGANYAFALDTTRLVNETNLATTSSPSYVYFSGVKFRSCKTEYAFRREPTKANMERSDFEIIPGIGVTSERTGVNASEAESNQLRLIKINGLTLDDYIDMNCTDKKAQAGTTIAPWTPPVDYGNTNAVGPTPYKEPNKEDASIQQPAARPAYNPNTGLLNCPEPPGPGYHIVQPGENLKAIARTYQVKEADVIAWNKIKNPNRIEICQKIWLKRPPTSGKVAAQTVVPQIKTPAPVRNINPDRKVADQSALWSNRQEAKGATAPAQYSAPTPKNFAPAKPSTKITPPAPVAKATQPAQPVQNRVHRVKSGDYLYKIAKTYGCAEECIRRANNMKLEGDVPLWPGQELIIPDCTCTMSSSKAATVAPQNNLLAPQTYSTYNNPQPEPIRTQAAEAPAGKQPAASDDSGRTYFTEYVVQQGETLNSIAYKFKVNGSELAQINGLSPTETLIPGKRILIPHKG